MRSSFCPAAQFAPLHDGSALQSGIDVSAYRIPCFAAKSSVHQVIEIVLPGRAFEQKGVARLEEGARAGSRIGKVFFLKVREAFCFEYCDSAFVLHGWPP